MALKKATIVWQFRIFAAWPERRVAQGAAFAGAKDALVQKFALGAQGDFLSAQPLF
jgi:hypothetical protein